MIFAAMHEKVRTDVNPDGPKTMTRRTMEWEDELEFDECPGELYLAQFVLKNPDIYKDMRVQRVVRNGRTLYRLGQQLANQPGRGKKANGRTPPVTEIRLERVGDITPEDCRAEGISRHETMPVRVFEKLWDGLHPSEAKRWPMCPVYVVSWAQK